MFNIQYYFPMVSDLWFNSEASWEGSLLSLQKYFISFILCKPYAIFSPFYFFFTMFYVKNNFWLSI